MIIYFKEKLFDDRIESIDKEATELDYAYTDYVLLADALLDTSLKEADILDRENVIDQINSMLFKCLIKSWLSQLINLMLLKFTTILLCKIKHRQF